MSSAPRLQSAGQSTSHAPTGASAQQSVLSSRQLEVARLVSAGLSNAAIAERLVIAPGTVANHVQHILVKLGMRTRVQIALWAVERGLIESAGASGGRDEPERRVLIPR